MGIITKEVEVKPNGKMLKYYRDKGYKAEYRQPLIVKVEDLPRGSKVKILVKCDYCGEEKWIHYRNYLDSIEKYGLYSCNKCLYHKSEETNLLRYGTRHYSSTSDCKEKVKATCLLYYGTDCVSKSEEIKEKTRLTNIKKYGVPYTQQSPEVRAKANETLCKNGNQKTSKQQLYLHSLYGGELNFFVKYYATDICFPEEKLIIEYDGGGHALRVVLGRLTQEEFDQKEIIRNNILKREGYKRINIVSNSDKLPQDDVLLKMLFDARTYFQTTSHTWQTYDIDKSLLFNAENINGIPYDFGALRTIKDNDIQNQPDIEQQTTKKGA